MNEMPQQLKDAVRFLRDIRRDFQDENKMFTDSLCEEHAVEVEHWWEWQSIRTAKPLVLEWTTIQEPEPVPVEEIARGASALRLWSTELRDGKKDGDVIDRWLRRLEKSS